MLKSACFRFRRARAAALLIAVAHGYALAVGCSGQTTQSPDKDSVAGMTQSEGGKTTTSPATAGAGQGGKSSGASGHGGVSGSGNSIAGGGVAGGSALGGQATAGGDDVGGAAGTSDTGDGGAGGERTIGVTGGRKICIDNRCGFACLYQSTETFPGDPFWIDCNTCQCNWDGSFDCETKDCTKDCAYFEDEYQAAYGEAQYCLMDPGKPDPCTRTQSASLYCNCPTAVSTDPEFVLYSQGWVKRWNDGGCTKPDDVVCAPCHPIAGAHCDMDQGVCVSN